MNLEELFAKIAAQQGEEGSVTFMLGEQLKEIAAESDHTANLILQDIDKECMGLEDLDEHFAEYAEKHKGKANRYCITPKVADTLIRDFYGLPERDATPAPVDEKPSGLLDLEIFL